MAEIPATPADGNVAVWFVPAIADPSAPTVAELTGAGVVDLSCYLTGDGLALSVDQATISDERLCSTQVYGQPGRKTFTASVTYIDNTNSDNETDSNEAADTLIEGTSGYLVTRRGLPYEVAPAADQKVSVWPIGAGMPTEVAPEANSVLRTTQALYVQGEVHQKVALTAA